MDKKKEKQGKCESKHEVESVSSVHVKKPHTTSQHTSHHLYAHTFLTLLRQYGLEAFLHSSSLPALYNSNQFYW